MQIDLIQSVKVLYRTKRQREGEFGICLGWDIHLLSFQDLGSLVVSPLNLDWIIWVAFLIFQLADSLSWDFSVSTIGICQSYHAFSNFLWSISDHRQIDRQISIGSVLWRACLVISYQNFSILLAYVSSLNMKAIKSWQYFLNRFLKHLLALYFSLKIYFNFIAVWFLF